MRNRTLSAVVLLMMFTAGAFAQSFSVDFVDGTVELKIPRDKAGKEWKALAIGDSLALDASLRVAAESSIEITRGKVRITILKPGTYMLADLSRAKEKSSGTGIGSAISQKLTALTKERSDIIAGTRASAVGGVRNKDQGTSSGSVMWVEENEETRRKVTELMAGGKYKEAVSFVSAAIPDAATDEEKDELEYMLAAAYYGNGEALRAYRAMAKLTPDPQAEFYPRFVLLKAQILIDSLGFSDGLALLKPFIEAGQPGETAQMAYLLAAACQKGLGDDKAALASLKVGYSIDPSTETAKLISVQLGK
jgi:hypothetical protein